MLKKEYRLKSVLLKSPRIFPSPLFTLKVASNNGEFNRFAFVVSKKIDKRAVVRNNVKRKIRGVIEQMFDNIETGNDFVVYPKGLAVRATRGQVLEEIKGVFSKNKLLK